MVTRVCAHCGKSYDTYPSIKPKYCSQACVTAAKVRGTLGQCTVCGKDVWSYPSRPRRYCSKSCATTARNLSDQNPAYRRDISGANNPMYGRGLAGETNPMYGKRLDKAPRWKGGRKIRKDGYVLVVAPAGHPYPADTHATGLAYILEHRLVMEQSLGRYLTPGEVVHHLDGNPSNNALSNLHLYASHAEHITQAHGGKDHRRTQR